MKTKPTSFRFDEDDLILAKNKSGIKKTQKLMDFLLSEYVREFKPKFVPLPEDYVEIKKVTAIKSDGTKIDDITKPTSVLKPKEQPKTNFSVNTTPKPEKSNFEQAIEGVAKDSILKEIAAIKAEKIPKERDTPTGRRAWLFDQTNRIKELQNKIRS